MSDTGNGAAVRDFVVPDLGEGLESATIVRWAVEVGQVVDLNQVLCTVETAKAEVDLPSPYAGTIEELGAAENEELPVGQVLVRIRVRESTRSTLVGYGHDESSERSTRARGGGPRASSAGPPSSTGAERRQKPLAKPPVRKLARDLGVSLSDIGTGSGPEGVITREDVRAAAEQGSVPSSVVEPAPEAPGVAGGELLRLTGVRARIAERMATSRSRIPDATCSVDVDCTRLLEVRSALNEAAGRRDMPADITPFALLCRLLLVALVDNKVLNSSFVEEGPAVHVHDAIHLGIGTATDRGLLVGVVRDAHQLTTIELASEMARLATGARSGTLSPGELQGSTFTVSNFGALGIDNGIPVINHPEAAILGIGSIKERPVVVDGAVTARPTVTLTLAFDHRVCDGAEAGRFVTSLRRLVEAPELGLLTA